MWHAGKLVVGFLRFLILKNFNVKVYLDSGHTYPSEITRIICSETICIASTGSPAELSPSTLSPVNHSLGKLEILLIVSVCVMTLLYIYNYVKNENVLLKRSVLEGDY